MYRQAPKDVSRYAWANWAQWASLCATSRGHDSSLISAMTDTHDTLRYEKIFELPGPAGKVQLKIQQGGAGRFYIIATLPAPLASNEIVLSVPSELADSLNHAIGKAADGSGE